MFSGGLAIGGEMQMKEERDYRQQVFDQKLNEQKTDTEKHKSP